MLASFEVEVWDACDEEHPVLQKERKKERQIRERRETMEKISRDLVEGLSRWKGTENIPTEVGIDGDEEKLRNGRDWVEIARRVGLNLLDIEEMFDIWATHVPNVYLDVQETSIQTVLSELWRHTTVVEARRFYLMMKRVRRRHGNSPQSEVGDGVGLAYEEPNVFTFLDFAITFGKFLKHQEVRAKTSRCTLARFQLTYVDRFRDQLTSATPGETKQMVDDLNSRLSEYKSLVAVNDLKSECLFELGLNLQGYLQEAENKRLNCVDEEDEFDASSSSGSSWGSDAASPGCSLSANFGKYQEWKRMWRQAKKDSELGSAKSSKQPPARRSGKVVTVCEAPSRLPEAIQEVSLSMESPDEADASMLRGLEDEEKAELRKREGACESDKVEPRERLGGLQELRKAVAQKDAENDSAHSDGGFSPSVSDLSLPKSDESDFDDFDEAEEELPQPQHSDQGSPGT